MQLLKRLIFGLIIMNIPAACVIFFGFTVSGIVNYAVFILLLGYYFISDKTKTNTWLLVIGITYYLISSFTYAFETNFFIFTSLKFMVIVLCGYELIKKISKEELYYFLIIAVLSIGVHAAFFTSDFGRYSGFYLNPNVAGFVCISGFGLTYGLKSIRLKLLGQFIFSLMGFLTFSRTFIVLWIFLNLLSIRISFKNIRIFAIGFGILVTMTFIDQLVGLDSPRFKQLMAIANNEQVSTSELNEASRTETWARFYDIIYEKPIFGNGYGTFQGTEYDGYHGVHNTYLLLIGEAGVIPFLLFISYLIYLLYNSFMLFNKAPNLLMQSVALSVFLLANHNFFNFYYITFIAMWIQYQINNHKKHLNPN
ncbi:O-antigen ligase family protein [uncultured Croceitalea sp.]|uniref:O-antigen ligase family protein n=1 Tax=uncultured Croceitalea sp. TaxID=1798908 RepID=UPI00374F982F